MEFMEIKRKKERGLSNEEFMDKTKKFFEDADCIVVIGMDSEGIINTFYTQTTSVGAIGMMEIGKAQLIEEMEV